MHIGKATVHILNIYFCPKIKAEKNTFPKRSTTSFMRSFYLAVMDRITYNYLLEAVFVAEA